MKLTLLSALLFQALTLQDAVTGFLILSKQSRRVFVAFSPERPQFPLHTNSHERISNLPASSLSSSVELPLPNLIVLIPAFNEEDRITETLETYSAFLESSRWKDCSRIVVVDDGSADQTATVVQDTADNLPTPIKCVPMPANGGKGAALSFGIDDIARSVKEEESTTASVILTTDADGSAPPEGIDAMYECLASYFTSNSYFSAIDSTTDWFKQLSEKAAVVAGYRTYESASPSRLIFRWGFRTAVKAVCGDLGVNDSQCGFKLLTIPAATTLYRNLYIPGWSHDVEVLYRARELGVPVMEQETEWEDKDGSKLVATPGGIPSVVIKMAGEVFRLRDGYQEGGWKLPELKRRS